MSNLGFSSKQMADDVIEAISRAVVYFDPDDYKKRYKCTDRTFAAADIHTYCEFFRTRTRNTVFEVDDLKRGFRSQIIRNALHHIIPVFKWEKDFKGVIVIKGEFLYSYKIDYCDVLNASDEVLKELKTVLKLDDCVDRSEICAALCAEI